MLQPGIAWLKKHWRWLLLNLFALAIMIHLLRMVNISTFGVSKGASVFDVTFMESGRWAIRFLLISLSITPIHRIFGWNWAIPLRKPAGVWAFGFASLHFAYYVVTGMFDPKELVTVPYVMVGFTSLSMLALMAITSNRWAMKWLGKAWKRLHRLVYAVSMLVILHVFLALTSSKKSIMNPGWFSEYLLYGVIAGILLALRITVIRNFLVSLLTFGRVKIKRKRSDTEQPVLAAE
jgi:methionine sulfoxide reductase heme-binding subunit